MLTREYPDTVSRLTGFGGYMRTGMFDGRGACDTGPARELEGATRDNVVAAASGLSSVGGTEELGTDTANKEVSVT
jgi:hypothetical protein